MYPDCLLYTVNGQHEEEWSNLYKSLYKVLEEDNFLFLDEELDELPKHFMTQSLKKYSANFLNKVLDKWNRIDYRIIENIIDALDFNDEFSEDQIIKIIDDYSTSKSKNYHSRKILSKVVHKTVDNTEKHYAYFKKIIEETKEENWEEYSNVLSEDQSPLISLELINGYQGKNKFNNRINKRINYLLKRIREISYSSLEDQLIHQMILRNKGFDYVKSVSRTILHGLINEKETVYKNCIYNHPDDKEIIRIARALLSAQDEIKKEWSSNHEEFVKTIRSDIVTRFQEYNLAQIDKILVEGHQLIRKLVEFNSSEIIKFLFKSEYANKIHLNGFEKDNQNPLIFSIVSKNWNMSVLLILGGAKTNVMFQEYSLVDILHYDESEESKELMAFIKDLEINRDINENCNLIKFHLKKLLSYYSIIELFGKLNAQNQIEYYEIMKL